MSQIRCDSRRAKPILQPKKCNARNHRGAQAATRQKRGGTEATVWAFFKLLAQATKAPGVYQLPPPFLEIPKGSMVLTPELQQRKKVKSTVDIPPVDKTEKAVGLDRHTHGRDLGSIFPITEMRATDDPRLTYGFAVGSAAFYVSKNEFEQDSSGGLMLFINDVKPG